jgi:hypothetical protein
LKSRIRIISFGDRYAKDHGAHESEFRTDGRTLCGRRLGPFYFTRGSGEFLGNENFYCEKCCKALRAEFERAQALGVSNVLRIADIAVQGRNIVHDNALEEAAKALEERGKKFPCGHRMIYEVAAVTVRALKGRSE